MIEQAVIADMQQWSPVITKDLGGAEKHPLYAEIRYRHEACTRNFAIARFIISVVYYIKNRGKFCS